MVKEIKKGQKTWYQCEVCGHHYKDMGRAKECETWCNGHDAANPEITAYSLELE
jgi:hypothetical protein